MMPALLATAIELAVGRKSFQPHMPSPAWHMALHSAPRDARSMLFSCALAWNFPLRAQASTWKLKGELQRKY